MKKEQIFTFLSNAGFNKIYAFEFATFKEATTDCERIQFVAVKKIIER